MMAAVYGREEIVKILLEAGANKEAKSKNGEMTPLIRACFQGHIAVVKLLIDAKANTEAKAKNGKTALDYAKQQHHDHCVALLQGLTPPPMTEEEATDAIKASNMLGAMHWQIDNYNPKKYKVEDDALQGQTIGHGQTNPGMHPIPPEYVEKKEPIGPKGPPKDEVPDFAKKRDFSLDPRFKQKESNVW